jgi:hypothetical protein
VKISITKNTLTPELVRLINEAKRPRALFQAGAKTVQVEISKHLRRLQARGNDKGWPSQKFFAGKATSVERQVGVAAITDRGALITIADARFVHRIQGGTVTAKRTRMLAIPLTAEAYAAAGKGSIKESMPGLKVIVMKGAAYLVREKAGNRNDKGQFTGGSGEVRLIPLFKLVRSVTHRPHPEELPDEKILSRAAQAAMFTAAKILFQAK